MTTPFYVGQYMVVGDDGSTHCVDSQREAHALQSELNEQGVYAYVQDLQDALAVV